jgi:hypothetical protein
MENNKLDQPNYEVEITQEEVRVQYTPLGAGCIAFAGGFMTFLSLFTLFFIPFFSGIVRGIMAIIVGLISTMFFLPAFLAVVFNMMKNRVQFRIRDGRLINKKHSIELSKIKEIDHGQYFYRITGWAFRSIRVKTTDNKTRYFDYYNLVSNATIEEIIEKYIIPRITSEGREKWEYQKSLESVELGGE